MKPAIRALYVWNSNPAVIAADQQQVLEGLAREDLFTVVHDQFITDTARYADIVLPATTMLEHPDLVGSWGFSYLRWNEAAIDPVGESKSNAEVTRLLAARLGFADEVFQLDDHQLMELALSDSPAAAEGLTAQQLRTEGFMRVGPPVGTAVAADATFAFSNDALAAAPGCTRSPSTAPRPYCQTPQAVPTAAADPQTSLLDQQLVREPAGDAQRRTLRSAADPPDRRRGPSDRRRGAGLGPQRPRQDSPDRGGDRQGSGRNGCGPVRAMGNRSDGRRRQLLTSDSLGDLANGPTFCDNLVEVELSR